MVLYFSGTGNSQFVALRLAKLLGEDEAVSWKDRMNSGPVCSLLYLFLSMIRALPRPMLAFPAENAPKGVR